MSADNPTLPEMFREAVDSYKELFVDWKQLLDDYLALAQAIAADFTEDSRETRAVITLRAIVERKDQAKGGRA